MNFPNLLCRLFAQLPPTSLCRNRLKLYKYISSGYISEGQYMLSLKKKSRIFCRKSSVPNNWRLLVWYLKWILSINLKKMVSNFYHNCVRIYFPGTFSIDFVLLSGHDGHIVRIIDGEVTNHGTKYTIDTMQYQIHPTVSFLAQHTIQWGNCLTFSLVAFDTQKSPS